jgi:K+-transporting ATPase KdpF subunit
LAAGDVSVGHCIDGTVLPVHESLRQNIRYEVMPMMIYLTAVVVVFLFVYLVAAMIRPEWF